MIEAIAKLGTLTLAGSLPAGLSQYHDLSGSERDELGALVEPPGADKVIVLVFDRDPPKFRGHHLEDCKNNEPLHYLYRSGPPNGPLALPYGQVTGRLSDKEREAGKSIVKIVKNRLVGWANALTKEADGYRELLGSGNVAWLKALAKEIDAKQQELSDVVEHVLGTTPGKVRLFLTLAFRDGESDLHLGDPSLPFARLFLARSRARMFEGEERIGTCSLCGAEAAVSPKFGSDIFPFATFDQPTYIAGGMRQRDAWRSFALCSDCYRAAGQGRRFTEAHLTRRFGAGASALTYWAVPSLLNPNTEEESASEVLGTLKHQEDAGGTARLTARERKVLLTNEDDLLDQLKELNDYVSFSLIFVEKQKARERILLTVDDVLPSRLRRLFAVKTEIEARNYNLGYLPDGWEFTLYRHLSPLCEVDRGGGKTELRRADFLAILDHIFRGVPLEAPFLANIFAGPLRTRFVAWGGELPDENQKKFRAITQAAWLTWHFLDGLDLMLEKETLMMADAPTSSATRPTGTYFEWLEGFFDASARTFQSDAARVAFLLGSLSDRVRGVQLDRLNGSAPFAKYFKSLKMDQSDLLELLPRITTKLTEYDALDVRNRQMLEAVSFYLTRAGIESWQLTSAQINVLFSMGMNLGFIVRRGPGKAEGPNGTDPVPNSAEDNGVKE